MLVIWYKYNIIIFDEKCTVIFKITFSYRALRMFSFCLSASKFRTSPPNSIIRCPSYRIWITRVKNWVVYQVQSHFHVQKIRTSTESKVHRAREWNSRRDGRSDRCISFNPRLRIREFLRRFSRHDREPSLFESQNLRTSFESGGNYESGPSQELKKEIEFIFAPRSLKIK